MRRTHFCNYSNVFSGSLDKIMFVVLIIKQNWFFFKSRSCRSFVFWNLFVYLFYFLKKIIGFSYNEYRISLAFLGKGDSAAVDVTHVVVVAILHIWTVEYPTWIPLILHIFQISSICWKFSCMLNKNSYIFFLHFDNIHKNKQWF